MSVFCVTADRAKPELQTRVLQVYPAKHYRHSDSTWFVRDQGTTQAIAEKLGIARDGITGVVVLPVPGFYWGVASGELWEWLKAAIEADRNG